MTICPECLGECRFDVSEPNPVGSRTPQPDWRNCQRCLGAGWVGEYHKTDPLPDLVTWLADQLRIPFEDAAIAGLIDGDAT